MVDASLVRRLGYSKLLFLGAKEGARGNTGFAMGRTVLGLQDAAEMAIRTLAEIADCKAKGDDSFDELIRKVVEKTNVHVNRLGLKQMNQSRVNFKHYGNLPDKVDVDKHVADVELFLIETFRSIAGIEYDRISLAALVENVRCRTYLVAAETSFANENYQHCVLECTKAFRITVRSQNRPTRRHDVRPRGFQLRQIVDTKARAAIEELTKWVDDLADELELMMFGVVLADYHRFLSITPRANVTMDGKFHFVWGPQQGVVEKADAEYCIRFATESALQMEARRLPADRWRVFGWSTKYRVIKSCEVVVYPSNPEVVRKAIIGEVVVGSSRTRNGWTEINQDNIAAFMPSECLETIEKDEA